jgi:SNF2 family DNA or RNA helicase
VPGAGKTSVELARILINDLDRVIVFVPNELVSDEWQAEVEECFPENTYKQVVLNGNLENFNLYLDTLLTSEKSIGYVNYAQIQDKEKENSLKSFFLDNRTHLVLDESHKIKGGKKPNRNKPSSRGSALLRLALFAERRDILTGTPMPHGIWDLISQMEFLYPYSGLDQSILVNEDSPKNAVQGIFSRTTKSDLKEHLPDFKDYKQPVEMKIAQMAFYESVVNFYAREFHGVPLNTITDNVRKAVKRIIELSVDPYNVVKKIREEDDSISDFFKMDAKESLGLDKVLQEGKISNKMQAAITMAEEIVAQGEKVVIWSNFRNPIILLEEQLQHLGAVTLFGGTTDVKESVDLFKNDIETMVLIGNPQKGGEGISLHKACHNAIYLDRDYDAGKYLQSRDRIHRIGLSNPKSIICNYYFLESVHPGTDADHPVIDERVSINIRKKLEKMEKLLSDEDLGVYIMTEDQSNEWESKFSNDDLQDGLDWFYSFSQ